ncbi:MAG: BPL-N domain-containing protein [Brevinemataceae bacterium]
MILLYNDEGVGSLSLHALKDQYEHFGFKTQFIGADEIIQNKFPDAEALVFPGGADLPYCRKLNGAGNSNIKQFVRSGGVYIGICAGAYYGCSSVEFKGEEYSVSGNRELSFFEGKAIGSIPELSLGNHYSERSLSKSIVNIEFQGKIIPCYYHGGPYFTEKKESEIIGYYSNGEPAIVVGQYGYGKYLLSGVHFEYDGDFYQRCMPILSCNDGFDPVWEENIVSLLQSSNRSPIWNFIRTELL